MVWRSFARPGIMQKHIALWVSGLSGDAGGRVVVERLFEVP